MAKKETGSQRKVHRAMHEYKEGSLRSGSGKKVTSRKQAIAIGLNEARESGAKVPARKPSSSSGSSRRTNASSSRSRSSSSRSSSRSSRSR